MYTGTSYTVDKLRQAILAKFPDAIPHTAVYPNRASRSEGAQNQVGITFGQVVELTSGDASGRGFLALRMLPITQEPIYWLSLSGASFPVPQPGRVHFEVKTLKDAISTTIGIINSGAYQRVVLDVRNVRDSRQDFRPRWYQLRRVVVRQSAQLVIITPAHVRLLPDSVVTKKIATQRTTAGTVQAHIQKSRCGGEGMRYDVPPLP